MTTATADPIVPLFLAGKWRPSRSPETGTVWNPSTGKVLARVPHCTTEEVDEAVRAAAAALPAWAETPAVDRARVLFRFRDKLDRHADELARLVTREHGKTLGEAK